MDLENTIRNEVRQRRQILYAISYMWNLINNTNESTYKTEITHTYRKQTYGYQRGRGENKLGV